MRLLELHRQFSALTFGLILCSLALVGALTWHNRLLTRAHRNLSLTTSDLKQSANDLAAANRAVAAANEELIQQNGRLIEKEDALRAQNVLFDAALNNMSQGLCMFDDDLRPIVRNRQFERMFRIEALERSRRPAAPQLSLRDLIPDIAPTLDENIKPNRKAAFDDRMPRRAHHRRRAAADAGRRMGGDLRRRDPSSGRRRPTWPIWRATTS